MDLDVYNDIADFDLGDEIEKLKTENRMFGEHIQSLESDIEKLTITVTKLKENQDNLTKNISSLYLTAKSEIERKDRMITELRTELDNMYFRRHKFGAPFKRKHPETINSEENDSKRRKTDDPNQENKFLDDNRQFKDLEDINSNKDSVSTSGSIEQLNERNDKEGRENIVICIDNVENRYDEKCHKDRKLDRKNRSERRSSRVDERDQKYSDKDNRDWKLNREKRSQSTSSRDDERFDDREKSTEERGTDDYHRKVTEKERRVDERTRRDDERDRLCADREKWGNSMRGDENYRVSEWERPINERDRWFGDRGRWGNNNWRDGGNYREFSDSNRRPYGRGRQGYLRGRRFGAEGGWRGGSVDPRINRNYDEYGHDYQNVERNYFRSDPRMALER